MAECGTCGVAVRWARKEGGGWHPPLEELGLALVVDGKNVVRNVPTYEGHQCKPEDIEARQAAQAERNEEADRNRAAFVEAEAQRAHNWRISLPYSCRKCGAGPMQACENLVKRAKGEKVATRWPHQERLPSPSIGLSFEEALQIPLDTGPEG